jgi:hypothetical protein
MSVYLNILLGTSMAKGPGRVAPEGLVKVASPESFRVLFHIPRVVGTRPELLTIGYGSAGTLSFRVSSALRSSHSPTALRLRKSRINAGSVCLR